MCLSGVIIGKTLHTHPKPSPKLEQIVRSERSRKVAECAENLCFANMFQNHYMCTNIKQTGFLGCGVAVAANTCFVLGKMFYTLAVRQTSDRQEIFKQNQGQQQQYSIEGRDDLNNNKKQQLRCRLKLVGILNYLDELFG